MSSAPISQREARRLKKRVQELESLERARRYAYAKDYPGGVHIASVAADDILLAKLSTARKLSHGIVCALDGSSIMYFAVPNT